MYAPMQDVLNLLKSTKLTDRSRAIEELMDWNVQLNLEDAIDLLEEAGSILPISNEEWDDPSNALVRAACVFIHEEMIPIFEKNVFKYSYQAINFVCSLLIISSSDRAVTLYKKIFQKLYFQVPLIPLDQELQIILEEKERTITAIKVLVENKITLHPWYEPYFHYLVATALKQDYLESEEVPLDKDFIRGELQSLFDRYQEYHADYKRKYVYEVWKKSYLELRFYLGIYLPIYSASCSVDELWSLKNILNFNDNHMKLQYIEILWKRKFNHELLDQEVLKILVSDEGTHRAYRILEDYKPELIPKDLNLQTTFVKEAAENLILNSSVGNGQFPTEVEVMGDIQITDALYGDHLTYYIVRYKPADTNVSDNSWMRMLMGAYYTSEIPTPWHPYELDDSYTDFILWESKSYEEHADDFHEYLAEKQSKYKKDEVFYQSTPSYNRHNNTMALLLFAFSFGLIWVSDWFILALPLPFIWLFMKYLHFKRLEKNILIQIRGYFFDYFYFNNDTCIELRDISKIHYEKRTVAGKERFLKLPFKTWHYILYDYGDNEIYAIPANYLLEAYFIPILQSRTSHLSQQPVLSWEVEA